MADIQYLNYGDLQIELLALLNNLANLVQGYVQKQPWSNKRKEMFMSAYSELMNRGILGASNATGQWMLNVGGDTPLNLDSKSKKEKEMYLEAAYFIQQQMAGLPTKASQEERKKEDLPVFDNKTFKDGFLTQLSNDYFGGNPKMKISLWNEYDKRDESTGLRPRTKRAEMLINSLEKYAKTLKDSDYNFKDSPFGSLEEFNNRIANARKALINTPNNTDDDFEALNALGIDASEYFNNGSGDPFKKGDYEGTYGGYYNEYLPSLEKKKAEELATKQKAEAAAKNQALANQYKRFRFHTGIGVTPQDLSKYPDLIGTLNGYNTGNQLNQQLKNELIGAFQFAAKNGQLLNLSKEELSKFGSGYANSPNRLKKLPGLNGFYWDSIGNRVIQPFMDVATLLSFLDLINLNGEEALILREKSRTLSDGLTSADIADISAALTDTLGVGATFIPVIGNFAGAATGLLGSIGHFVGDVLRDGIDWGDAGRLALNAGFDLATLLPGLGTAAKAGKVAKALGPWIPRIIATIGVYQGITNGEEMINSFKKLGNPSTVTVQDLQNISQGIALIAGGVNVTRGEMKLRLMKKATPSKEATVTTLKGQEVKLSESEYNTITSKNATREAKNQVLLTAALRQGIDLSNDGLVYKGRSVTHPMRTSDKSVDVDLIKAPIQGSPTSVNISEIRRHDKEWLAKNRWATSILPGRTLNLKLNWTNNGIYTRGWKELSQNNNNLQRQLQNLQQQLNLLQQQLLLVKFTPENRKNIQKVKKEMEQILNPTKSRKPIKVNNDGKANIEANINGEKVSIEYNKNTNELIINNNKYNVKNGFEIRQKVLSEILERRANSRANARQNKSINKFNIDINELKKLKKFGFLKQGGIIDKQKIQKYKEFIKK